MNGNGGKLGPAVQAMAVRFQDQAAYNAAVLTGAHTAHPVAVYPAEPAGVTLTDLLVSFASVAGALILAWVALYWRRLPVLRGYRPSDRLAAAARRFQSGVVFLALGGAGLSGEKNTSQASSMIIFGGRAADLLGTSLLMGDLNATDESPGVTDNPVGAPGTVRGVPVVVAAGPVPASFDAASETS